MESQLTELVVKGFNWAEFLRWFGLGLLGLGLSGSAIGLSIAGCAVTGVKDEKRGQSLAVSVLPGTQGLYSFAVGFLCLLMAKDLTALQVFACGTITGIACLFSGWWQGVVCAAGVKSINQDKMGVGQAILLAVLPEFYAILSFAFSALIIFVFNK
jgi:V/A-type H+-transporting ATPase subunit K